MWLVGSILTIGPGLVRFGSVLAAGQIEGWPRSKRKLIKIGVKVVSHRRYIAFQMAEVAMPRQIGCGARVCESRS